MLPPLQYLSNYASTGKATILDTIRQVVGLVSAQVAHRSPRDVYHPHGARDGCSVTDMLSHPSAHLLAINVSAITSPCMPSQHRNRYVFGVYLAVTKVRHAEGATRPATVSERAS